MSSIGRLLEVLASFKGIFDGRNLRTDRRKSIHGGGKTTLSKEIQAYKINAAEAKRRRKAEKRLKDAMK